ncbi:MAG: toxin TcdB middle/N-terminal domain-containing protein, partial [Myxococcota bacterium]
MSLAARESFCVSSLWDCITRTWILLTLVIFSVWIAGGPARAMVGEGGGESSPFANASADASANFFTGAASARVPILVPPGRALVTPSLSLGYSSQSGLSSAGFGWALPLGVLTRATNRGVPTCDGAEMNRYVVSLSASANELVEASPDRYLLKVDEGYTEALPDRAANTWEVRTREGVTYTFGGSEASRVFSGGDAFHDVAGCAFTTAWHLTRVEDPNGNLVEVMYEKSGNSPRPVAVEYGGNADAGIPHPYRVLIESEAIAPFGKPLMRSFTSGVEQTLGHRLKRIRVEGRERVDAPFSLIREYELSFDDAGVTQEFMLSAVAATGMPTRRFDYSTSEPTLVDSMSEVVEDAGQLGITRRYGTTMSLLDLNGDGLLDRLCVNSGSWHAAYGDVSSLQFSEYEPCDRSGGNWSTPDIPGLNLNRISRVVEGADRFLTLDLTGDGIPDLVRRLIGQSAIHVYPGSCSAAYQCGFSDQPEIWNNPGDLPLRRTNSGNRGSQLLADLMDMNADGLPDLLRVGDDEEWEVFLNTGSGFETAPLVYSAMDDLLSYSSYDGVNADHERALIDVNNDGLPDRVAAPSHSNPLNGSSRMPHVYFAVAPDGALNGPHALEDEIYLCPNGNGSTQAEICGNGSALPAGWALVGALSVRLNTGSGFAPPVYSPAPIWRGGNRSASRLRGTWEDSTAKLTRTYRDFVDVNGDGRVDWVSSGYPYDGSDDWFVLYNQGDGRFGGALNVVSPAFNEMQGLNGLGAHLGEVRPGEVLPSVGDFMGRSFAHTEPGDRSDLHATVLDIDADGLAERVRTFGSSSGDRWEVKAFRFEDEAGEQLRPRLLTRFHDGVGGITHFAYAPSSRFVGGPGEIPRMPFVTWVVTGLRETDGLCDATPMDWFTLAGNPCLASGHEQVRSIAYEGGLFDPVSREFRGFASVDVFEGPASTGTRRRYEYLQDDDFRGKTAREEVFVGGVDLLSRTEFSWGSVADGPRTQIYVEEQRVEEFVLYPQFESAGMSYADRCVVHRSSILDLGGEPDPRTRVHSACSMGCEGAGPVSSVCDAEPVGKKQVETAYADPIMSGSEGAPVWDRPLRVETTYVNAAGVSERVSEVEYGYDARGNLTLERQRVSEAPAAWTERVFTYDQGGANGPGNITSMAVPLPLSREPTTFEFSGDFRLYPTAENAATTTNAQGQFVNQRIERATDFRNGRVRRTIGVHGEVAGDVSGTIFDDQGRALCTFEPGTSCFGEGFKGSSESRYVYGTPGANAPVDRLNHVELRRREPRAPKGYLVTRSYWDALGRERFTTNEQSVAGQIETVVVRHFEYGPSGEVRRRYSPYVTNAATLNPPAGAFATELDYALNGNSSGYVDPARRVHQTRNVDGATPKSFYFGDTTRMI